MKKSIKVILFSLVTFIISSCSTVKTELIDLENDNRAISTEPISGDFQYFAGEMIDSLIRNGHLDQLNNGNRCTIVMGKMRNNTTLADLDTDLIMMDVKSALTRSGKAQISTRKSFSSMKNGPWAMSGKITGRKITISSNASRYEYYLLLTLTDLKSGLEVWQEKKTIVKHGAKRGF